MKYIAFLRAINVGGHTVKMADLIEIFKTFRVENVQTFIQSGNVLFESSEPEDVLTEEIESGLKESLGYDVATFLRTEAELKAIIQSNPFHDDDDPAITVYVTFLSTPPSAEQQKDLKNRQIETESYFLIGRDLYTRFRRDSKEQDPFSNAKIEKLFQQPATTRNMTTVRKIETILSSQ